MVSAASAAFLVPGCSNEIRFEFLRRFDWAAQGSPAFTGAGTPGCPLTVPGPKCDYITELVKGNLANAIEDHSSGRSVPNAALSQLLVGCPQAPGCCAPSTVACVQPPSPPVCEAAIARLQRFGRPGTSFGGQAHPLIWHAFAGSCFNATAKQWLFETINASLPMSIAESTPQEYSYTNMWLMSTVNSILYGEIVGGERGRIAATVGYEMWEEFYNYTMHAGLHEFTSPTYTYVQLTALYPGYIYAARPGARAQFGRILDMIWADTAANTFAPRGELSGPHSRDYDTLLGHGMLLIEMYLWGLPGATKMHCEFEDPHCEGPVAASDPRWENPDGTSTVGTGEPMTVVSISLFNLLHPRGYRPPKQLLALASTPSTRVITSRFLAQNITANGLEARFAELYNFVTPHFAIGSTSQEYITNTHSKYYPNVESKLLNILLGAAPPTPAYVPSNRHRESPAITLVGDWKHQPYGAGPTIHNHGTNNSHLALHLGAVQRREVLLMTSALDTADALQFNTAPGGLDKYASLTTNLLLPADAQEFSLLLPGGKKVSPQIVRTMAPRSWELPLGSILCVRIGGGGLCVKVFALDGVASQPPLLRLVADEIGLGLNAVRLVGCHYNSSVPAWLNGSTNGLHARFGALAIAGVANASGELATLMQRVSNATISTTVSVAGIWTVSATAELSGSTSVTLEVDRDLGCSNGGRRNQTVHTSWNCLIARRVDGQNIVPDEFKVNGVTLEHLLNPRSIHR